MAQYSPNVYSNSILCVGELIMGLTLSIDGLKENLSKVAEKVTRTTNKKEPDLNILSSFDSNRWKAVYLILFYVYHGMSRLFSLWLIFAYINSL